MADYVSDYDAVIVGAGVAGLNCAKRLRSAGASTVVLEASYHIGGRCRTLHESDMKAPGSHGWWMYTEGCIGKGNAHFDVGAEFIHGDETSLYKMAREQGWSMQKLFTWAQGDGGPNDEMVNGGAGYYYVDGRLYRFDELPPDFRETHEILSNMAEEYPVKHDEDMEAVLRSRGISDRSERLVQAGYANTAGGAFRVLGWRANCEAEHFYARDDGDHDFQVEQGFGDAVVGELEKDAGEIKVLHRVASITYGDDGKAVVRCANGRVFKTAHVVLCVRLVPMPILQGSYGPAESIEISPTLPQWKNNAIQDMTCSPSLKVYGKFSERFWPEDMHGMICALPNLIPEVWTDHGNDNVLCGFTMASWAERCGSMPPKKLLEAFLEQLDRVFDGQASKFYEGGMVFDWGKVPHIRVGYCPPSVTEQEDTRRKLAEAIRYPTGCSLHFAGEAAHPQCYMTAHGAMDSGGRAAEEVLQLLKANVAAHWHLMASSTFNNGNLSSVVRVNPDEWREPIPLEKFEEQLRTRDLSLEYRILRYMTETMEMVERCERGDEGEDRYRDIIPFKDTRARVGKSDERYINASYVTGGLSDSLKEPGFIAAQGPLETTILDFWSMIIHNRCELIFVLCQLREAGRSKCAQYWPSPMGESMIVESDGISWRVKLVLEESYKNYGGGTSATSADNYYGLEFDLVKRVFEVGPEDACPEFPRREIVQYQYLSWPDHGTPEVEQFIRIFKVFHAARHRLGESGSPTAPVVVHCSAGVGRTGCLIALERLVTEAEMGRAKEGSSFNGSSDVSVLATLQDMRNCRPLMVQTTGQYCLIYEAMSALVKSGFFEEPTCDCRRFTASVATPASPVADFVSTLEGSERRVPEWYNPEFVKLHDKLVEYLPSASLEGELLPLMKAVSATRGFGLAELVSAIENRLISLLDAQLTPSMHRATFVRLLLLLASSSEAPGVMTNRLRECLEAEAMVHIASYLKPDEGDKLMGFAALVIGCSQLSLSSMQLASAVQEVIDERIDELLEKLDLRVLIHMELAAANLGAGRGMGYSRLMSYFCAKPLEDLENIANLLLIQATTRSSHLALTAHLISSLDELLAKEEQPGEGEEEDQSAHALTALWSLVTLGHGQILDPEGRLPKTLASLLSMAAKWNCLDDPKMERQLQQLSLSLVLEHGEKPEVPSQVPAMPICVGRAGLKSKDWQNIWSSFGLVEDESTGAFGELMASIEGEVEDILDSLPDIDTNASSNWKSDLVCKFYQKDRLLPDRFGDVFVHVDCGPAWLEEPLDPYAQLLQRQARLAGMQVERLRVADWMEVNDQEKRQLVTEWLEAAQQK
ncbi:Lysine-specific histone demethylase 1B [Perkinsus chesapeaki]|uniref:Lysine-specific histone demethylase 1B n=1 Tax=Perkinsus chesapeaki TaxID=330153 RepID=A0A7J6LNN8_PERCH|nr:Lysine-specific histone demethylase 1B [Perkinsus chesapeaki]